jgi:hypothetical protein
LDHLFVGSAGNLDCRDNVARIATHEYDSRGLNRYVGSRPDGDSLIGGGQGRRIVNAIANHCYPLAACLKFFHCRCLVSGKNLGCDLIDSDSPGDRIGNRLRISGDHRDPDTKLRKFGDGPTGYWPNFDFNCESSEQPALTDGIENRLPIGCPCGCEFFNFWRHRYLGLDQPA